MLETVVTPSIHAISRHGARFMVVLVGLVAIFKKQLVSLVNNILAKITKQSNSI
ncbi:hypothetical protein LK520_12920 [Blautia sp. DFI.4.84]|nr:hypothetical protein [Blautia sp. DFI.4.84]